MEAGFPNVQLTQPIYPPKPPSAHVKAIFYQSSEPLVQVPFLRVCEETVGISVRKTNPLTTTSLCLYLAVLHPPARRPRGRASPGAASPCHAGSAPW